MNGALYPERPVLLVDDEPSWLHGLDLTLRAAGVNHIEHCTNSGEVMDLLGRRAFSVVSLDIVMPSPSGTELLPRIVEAWPDVPVIMLTGLNQLETAVECMKAGAFDYFIKTTEIDRLVAGIKRAVELHDLRTENALLQRGFFQRELRQPEAFAGFITQDPGMFAVFRYIETVAPTSRPVLITGESGVGKELAARVLHQLSGRGGRFVAVDAAGLDDTLFADTLFGHVRGAYTGADQTRPGLIEQAAGGTLFLDEIGDLSSASQVKLLRLLQEQEYLPLGADLPKRCDARVVVATNRDLAALQRSGAFRGDLFYRLHTHHVSLPPLRQRPGDIPLLVDRFLAESATELGKRKPAVPESLPDLLATHPFPGNIRELKALIYDAVSRHQSRTMPLDAFRERLAGFGRAAESPDGSARTARERDPLAFPETLPTLKEAARRLIEEALRRANGNQGIAAQMLGITRQALNKRIRQLEDNGD